MSHANDRPIVRALDPRKYLLLVGCDDCGATPAQDCVDNTWAIEGYEDLGSWCPARVNSANTLRTQHVRDQVYNPIHSVPAASRGASAYGPHSVTEDHLKVRQ